jgi:F0F1-type ATP synthase assembly protein I
LETKKKKGGVKKMSIGKTNVEKRTEYVPKKVNAIQIDKNFIAGIVLTLAVLLIGYFMGRGL